MLGSIWSKFINGDPLESVGGIFDTIGFFSTWESKQSIGSIHVELSGLVMAASNPMLYISAAYQPSRAGVYILSLPG